jgi:hypothetical protein
MLSTNNVIPPEKSANECPRRFGCATVGRCSRDNDVLGLALENERHLVMAAFPDIPADPNRIEFGKHGVEDFVAPAHG